MPIDQLLRQERIQSCLLGGALGDAWGGPYEGQRSPSAAPFPPDASLSDDTLLTAATCEGIIEGAGRVDPELIARRLRTWFEEGRLRGLGSSTLKALRDLSAGAHWALAGARGEFAAGSGSAMRAAPLAFVLDPAAPGDRRVIRDVSRITHHSDEAYAGALAMITAIRTVAQLGSIPADLLAVVAEALPDTAVRDRLAELSATTLSLPEAASAFGTSGLAAEAVPFALHIAVQSANRSLDEAVCVAVALGGDTDTIAALVGQLVGASGQTPSPSRLVQITDFTDVADIFRRFAECL